MYAHLVPLVSIDLHRGPALVKWRFGEGIDCRWSLQDFGNSPLALLITDIPIPGAFFSFDDLQQPMTGRQKAELIAVLRDGSIEPSWISNVASHREGLHRALGMSQSMQANDDAPDRWLGRVIHCGFDSLPPYDLSAFQREQISIAKGREIRVGDWILAGGNWVNERTGKTLPVIQGGALPATDAFTEASDTALTSHTAGGITWVNNSNAFLVVAATDDVRGNTASSECGAHDSTNTYANDQYAQVKMNTVSSNPSGPAVRCAAGATASYYGFYLESGFSYLFKMVTGSWTQKGSNGVAGVNGSTYKVGVVGTTLTPYKDGVETGIGAQTDSSLTSGYGGICSYSNSSVSLIDDYQADNIGTAGRTTKNTDSFQLGQFAGISRRMNIP